MSELDQEWSESLLESYGKLPLPSLYDYLLNQEKLAAEIRKQNKELRTHSEAINKTKDNINEILASILDFQQHLETIQREGNEERNEIHPSIKQMEQVLMGMMDALFHLLEVTKHTHHSLLNTIPEFTGFWKKAKPSWRIQAEEILESYYAGIEFIRDKALSALADGGILVIIPKIGTPFDPMTQRAVEQVSGEKRGHIAKMIRYGYRRRDEMLRYADVAVYQ